jgi:hypothetical protein
VPDVHYSLVEHYKAIPGVEGARPFVGVRLKAPGARVDTWALIDSGADWSLFHADWAEAFGIALDPQQWQVTQVPGGSVSIWFHEMELEVCGMSLQCSIGFSPAAPRAFGLLGRADFFRAFLVGFDHRGASVLLEPLGNPII